MLWKKERRKLQTHTLVRSRFNKNIHKMCNRTTEALVKLDAESHRADSPSGRLFFRVSSLASGAHWLSISCAAKNRPRAALCIRDEMRNGTIWRTRCLRFSSPQKKSRTSRVFGETKIKQRTKKIIMSKRDDESFIARIYARLKLMATRGNMLLNLIITIPVVCFHPDRRLD
jgi:hypothetical protein